MKCEDPQLPLFLDGVFPVCWEEQQSPIDLLESNFIRSNYFYFLRLTFRDLHDSPHLCPRGTGMHAGIVSVIVTWVGELLNKYKKIMLSSTESQFKDFIPSSSLQVSPSRCPELPPEHHLLASNIQRSSQQKRIYSICVNFLCACPVWNGQ